MAQRPGKPLWFGVAAPGPRSSRCPATPSRRWCACRDTSCRRSFCAMGAARQTRRENRARRSRRGQAPLAYFLPVRLETDDWGRAWAMPPDQRLRRFHGPRRHRRLRRAAARAEHLPKDLSPGCTVGKNRRAMSAPPKLLIPADRPRRAPRHAAQAAARPAHLGDGPLQFPLPVLHAARDLPREVPVSQIQRAPELRGNRAARAPVRAAGRAQAAPHRRRAAAARQPGRPHRRSRQHLPGIEDVALTTNGMLLAQHAAELQGRGPEARHGQSGQPRPASVRDA